MSQLKRYHFEQKIELENDGDPRAPGGAVTLELCGAYDHPPPCRWPHHTELVPVNGQVFQARVDYECLPNEELLVRSRIAAALGQGELVGPDGRRTRWG